MPSPPHPSKLPLPKQWAAGAEAIGLSKEKLANFLHETNKVLGPVVPVAVACAESEATRARLKRRSSTFDPDDPEHPRPRKRQTRNPIYRPPRFDEQTEKAIHEASLRYCETEFGLRQTAHGASRKQKRDDKLLLKLRLTAPIVKSRQRSTKRPSEKALPITRTRVPDISDAIEIPRPKRTSTSRPPRTTAKPRKQLEEKPATKIVDPLHIPPPTPQDDVVPVDASQSPKTPRQHILHFARGNTNVLSKIEKHNKKDALKKRLSLATFNGCDELGAVNLASYLRALSSIHHDFIRSVSKKAAKELASAGLDEIKVPMTDQQLVDAIRKGGREIRRRELPSPPHVTETLDVVQLFFRLWQKMSCAEEHVSQAFLDRMYALGTVSAAAALALEVVTMCHALLTVEEPNVLKRSELLEYSIRLLSTVLVYELSPFSDIWDNEHSGLVFRATEKDETPWLPKVVDTLMLFMGCDKIPTTRECRLAVSELCQVYVLRHHCPFPVATEQRRNWKVMRNRSVDHFGALISDSSFWSTTVSSAIQTINKHDQNSDSDLAIAFLVSLLSEGVGAKSLVQQTHHREALLGVLARLMERLDRQLLNSFIHAERIKRSVPELPSSIDLIQKLMSSAAIQRELISSRERDRKKKFLEAITSILTRLARFVSGDLDAGKLMECAREGAFSDVTERLQQEIPSDQNSKKLLPELSDSEADDPQTMQDCAVARLRALAFGAWLIGSLGKSMEDGSRDMTQMNGLHILMSSRFNSTRAMKKLWETMFKIQAGMERRLPDELASGSMKRDALLTTDERDHFVMAVEAVRTRVISEPKDRSGLDTPGSTPRETPKQSSSEGESRMDPIRIKVAASFPEITGISELRRAVASECGYEDFDDDPYLMEQLEKTSKNRGEQTLARYDPDSEFVTQWVKLRKNVYVDNARDLLDNVDKVEGQKCGCMPGNPVAGKSSSQMRIACSNDLCENRSTHVECVPGTCGAGSYCQNQRMLHTQNAKMKTVSFPRKGVGIVADEDISAGSFIGEYQGEVISMDMFEKRKKEYRGERHFYFMTLTGKLVIDASRKSQLTRYVNHSCEPNAETQKWNAGGEPRVGIFALRDIRKSEEITFDYGARSLANDTVPCLCGTKSCRGFLTISKKPDDKKDKDDEVMFDTSGFVNTEEDMKQLSAKAKAASILPQHTGGEGKAKSDSADLENSVQRKIQRGREDIRLAENLAKARDASIRASKKFEESVLADTAKAKLSEWAASVKQTLRRRGNFFSMSGSSSKSGTGVRIPRRQEPRLQERPREEPQGEEPQREEPQREEPQRQGRPREEKPREEPRREEPQRRERPREEPRREEPPREELRRPEPRRPESRRQEPRRPEPATQESFLKSYLRRESGERNAAKINGGKKFGSLKPFPRKPLVRKSSPTSKFSPSSAKQQRRSSATSNDSKIANPGEKRQSGRPILDLSGSRPTKRTPPTESRPSRRRIPAFLPTAPKVKKPLPKPKVAKRQKPKRSDSDEDSMDDYSIASSAEPVIEEEPLLSVNDLPDGPGACSDDEFVAASPVEGSAPQNREELDRGARMLPAKEERREFYSRSRLDYDRHRNPPAKMGPPPDRTDDRPEFFNRWPDSRGPEGSRDHIEGQLPRAEMGMHGDRTRGDPVDGYKSMDAGHDDNRQRSSGPAMMPPHSLERGSRVSPRTFRVPDANHGSDLRLPSQRVRHGAFLLRSPTGARNQVVSRSIDRAARFVGPNLERDHFGAGRSANGRPVVGEGPEFRVPGRFDPSRGDGRLPLDAERTHAGQDVPPARKETWNRGGNDDFSRKHGDLVVPRSGTREIEAERISRRHWEQWPDGDNRRAMPLAKEIRNTEVVHDSRLRREDRWGSDVRDGIHFRRDMGSIPRSPRSHRRDVRSDDVRNAFPRNSEAHPPRAGIRGEEMMRSRIAQSLTRRSRGPDERDDDQRSTFPSSSGTSRRERDMRAGRRDLRNDDMRHPLPPSPRHRSRGRDIRREDVRFVRASDREPNVRVREERGGEELRPLVSSPGRHPRRRPVRGERPSRAARNDDGNFERRPSSKIEKSGSEHGKIGQERDMRGGSRPTNSRYPSDPDADGHSRLSNPAGQAPRSGDSLKKASDDSRNAAGEGPIASGAQLTLKGCKDVPSKVQPQESRRLAATKESVTKAKESEALVEKNSSDLRNANVAVSDQGRKSNFAGRCPDADGAKDGRRSSPRFQAETAIAGKPKDSEDGANCENKPTRSAEKSRPVPKAVSPGRSEGVDLPALGSSRKSLQHVEEEHVRNSATKDALCSSQVADDIVKKTGSHGGNQDGSRRSNDPSGLTSVDAAVTTEKSIGPLNLTHKGKTLNDDGHASAVPADVEATVSTRFAEKKRGLISSNRKVGLVGEKNAGKSGPQHEELQRKDESRGTRSSKAEADKRLTVERRSPEELSRGRRGKSGAASVSRDGLEGDGAGVRVGDNDRDKSVMHRIGRRSGGGLEAKGNGHLGGDELRRSRSGGGFRARYGDGSKEKRRRSEGGHDLSRKRFRHDTEGSPRREMSHGGLLHRRKSGELGSGRHGSLGIQRGQYSGERKERDQGVSRKGKHGGGFSKSHGGGNVAKTTGDDLRKLLSSRKTGN